MLEGIIATFMLAGFGLYGMLRLLDDCFGRADEARVELDDKRQARQAEIRGAIHDAARVDDPLVRYDLARLIEEYRHA